MDGTPGGAQSLKCLPSPLVMIRGSWDRPPFSAGRLLLPVPLPLPLLLLSGTCSLSNKYTLEKFHWCRGHPPPPASCLVLCSDGTCGLQPPLLPAPGCSWSRCGGCRGPSLHPAALDWVYMVYGWLERGGVAETPLLGKGPAGPRRSERVLSCSFAGGGGKGKGRREIPKAELCRS